MAVGSDPGGGDPGGGGRGRVHYTAAVRAGRGGREGLHLTWFYWLRLHPVSGLWVAQGVLSPAARGWFAVGTVNTHSPRPHPCPPGLSYRPHLSSGGTHLAAAHSLCLPGLSRPMSVQVQNHQLPSPQFRSPDRLAFTSADWWANGPPGSTHTGHPPAQDGGRDNVAVRELHQDLNPRSVWPSSPPTGQSPSTSQGGSANHPPENRSRKTGRRGAGRAGVGAAAKGEGLVPRRPECQPERPAQGTPAEAHLHPPTPTPHPPSPMPSESDSPPGPSSEDGRCSRSLCDNGPQAGAPWSCPGALVIAGSTLAGTAQ